MTSNTELDQLFPITPITVSVRGVPYPVGKVTVKLMASVNFLTEKAYAVIDLEGITDEVDVAAIAAGAIAALIDGDEVQQRMATVVMGLTGMPDDVFHSLEIEELVDLIVKIVKVNKDFFSMRLAPKMRQALRGSSLLPK
jgi:hypothetical protein